MLRKGQEAEGTQPYCKWCESIPLRRAKRRGLLQKLLLPRLNLYPWRCEWCQRVYLLKTRTSDRKGGRHTPAGSVRSSMQNLLRSAAPKRIQKPL